MYSRNFSKRGQYGFTIIEALISLIIMGFGVLSLSGMQIFLSRNADDAKQRTEAVRLAQEKIEFFRSYTGIASTLTSGTALNWNDLASGTDTITTNAVYTRNWTIEGAISAPMRSLTVGVSWTDRTGEAQAVSLSTVLSKTDPADSGFLGFPLPENTNLKRPKNRNLNIPIPAIDIGNGKSAVAFGSDKYVLFSNISGDVVQICTPTLGSTPSTEDIITALTGSTTGNCTTITGYIVAGYVTRDVSVSNTDWDAVKNSMGIDYSNITRNEAGTSAIGCQFGDAINPSSGAIITNVKYYICVIPLAAPTQPLAENGPYNWSGTIRIAGPSIWNGSGNKYYVCRYQYSSASDLTDVNERNVQPYVKVNKSIDQQNYLVVTTTNAASSTTPACPGSMTVAGVSTGVLHQDCRSASNSNHSTACPLLNTSPRYTITYNRNNANSGTVPVDVNSPYTSGSLITVLGNTGGLALTGYNFGGWNTVAGGGGTAYTAGTSMTITGNTTLYAQWSHEPLRSITYLGNGNTGGAVPTDANSPYTSGSTIKLLGNTGALTKTIADTTYTFSGWTDDGGAVYAAGASLTITADITLSAKWTATQTYTVTYNGNGSDGGTLPVDSKSPYTSGSVVTVEANTGTLVKTGYAFNGWNTSTNGSGTNYSPSAIFNIGSNTTLYARWLQLKLSAPSPNWIGTDPKSLSWSPIDGATAYNVSSCSVINNASQTSCTPASPVTQSATSVLPLSLNTKDTRCYSISSVGSPYLDSNASAVKCIVRAANGNYSYQ